MRNDALTIGAATAVFAIGARTARHDAVGSGEQRWFGRINTLPERWFRPVWLLMQVGSLGGVAAAAGVLFAGGRRRLAVRVGASGGLAWGAAKAVKRFVGRGRPAEVLAATRVLGKAQTGLGYPSGHAAVTAAMVLAAAPQMSAGVRRVAWFLPLVVGSSRLYVGAHLPLDVAGGAALGVACASAVHAVEGVMDRA